MPKVLAIMVNWNGGRLAVESALSVVGQSVGPALWVVDNASQDGSADAIEKACPTARVIRNRTNLGYAAANNQALRAAAAAEYTLLVNNDVVFPDRHSLGRVVAHLDAHPEVHGACGRFEYPDGSFQSYYQQLPTAFNMMVNWGVGRHVPAFLRSRRSREYCLVGRDFTRPMSLEQPAFACVLMRGRSAQAVGLMDEQFPLFFNDVDYCWRWRERGWPWLYFPDWRVVHHQGKSTAKLGGLLWSEVASSAVRFARKHYPPPTAFLIRLTIVLEAFWKKVRHRDVPVRLADIWRGTLFFCQPAPSAPS